MAAAPSRQRLRFIAVFLGYTLGCGRIGFDLLPLPGSGSGGGAGNGGATDSGQPVDGSSPGMNDGDANTAADATLGMGGNVPDAEAPDGAGGTGQGGGSGSSPDASSSGGAGNGSGGADGSAGARDASSGSGGAGAIDAGSDTGGAAGSGPDAAPDSSPILGCTGGRPAQQTWSFATDLEGWIFASGNNASGGVRWSGMTGNPDPGALQFDATSGNGLIGDVLESLMNPVNLNGRTLSAWVMLSTTRAVTVNFIAANTLTSSAFGPAVPLAPGSWTCVTFTPDTPESAQPGYDPSQIRWIGLQASGGAPFRIFVDQVEY